MLRVLQLAALVAVTLAIKVPPFSIPDFRQNTVQDSSGLHSGKRLGKELSVQQPGAVYDNGLFTPLESLDLLSETSFSTLEHPAFPQHSVRIKKSKFCDGTVSSYTGYIDVEARHLFFYYFESRSDPENDDFIFWTNGGPGGSSALGLFMELGPCRVVSDNSTKYNPDSWNTNANVFFVDQPVGVGFSYAEYGEAVSNTRDAAIDIAAFMAIFFEHFSQYQGRPLHLAGESYGGRYLPLFGAAIYEQNAELFKANITPINLTSLMIGNGMTDFFSMMPAYVEMQCTAASVPPVQSLSTCVRMKEVLPRCEKKLQESCLDHFDIIDCSAAVDFCSTEIVSPLEDTGKNVYDLSKDCPDIGDDLCYPMTKQIAKYLNDPKVQSTLGVAPGTNYSIVNYELNLAFHQTLDEYRQTYLYVAALLERNVKVLVYVGSYDWICNWIGNERWTLDLNWSGHDEFSNQELREWNIQGSVNRAGLTRSARGLTFATIDGAGHMVPYDKPKESLELVKMWLAGKEL